MSFVNGFNRCFSGSFRTAPCVISGFKKVEVRTGIPRCITIERGGILSEYDERALVADGIIDRSGKIINVEGFESGRLDSVSLPLELLDGVRAKTPAERFLAVLCPSLLVPIYGANQNTALKAVKALENGYLARFNAIKKRLDAAGTPLDLSDTIFSCNMRQITLTSITSSCSSIFGMALSGWSILGLSNDPPNIDPFMLLMATSCFVVSLYECSELGKLSSFDYLSADFSGVDIAGSNLTSYATNVYRYKQN